MLLQRVMSYDVIHTILLRAVHDIKCYYRMILLGALYLVWYVYDAILYCMVWYGMAWHSGTIWYDVIRYGIVWYHTSCYDMRWYYTIRKSVISYIMVRNDMICYDMILYDTIWCSVISYWSISYLMVSGRVDGRDVSQPQSLLNYVCIIYSTAHARLGVRRYQIRHTCY